MPTSHKMIEIALAALLHDVGKLYERTGQKAENLEHLFKYSHAGFTSRFFQDLKRDEGHCGWANISLNCIETLASRHHNASDEDQKLIAIADCCSAGEREKLGELADGVPLPYGKSHRPLVSVFEQICLQKEKPNTTTWQYEPVTLVNHHEHVFPKQSPEDKKDGEQKYNDLYAKFYAKIRGLKDCPPQLLVDAVMGVCRSHWSLIPSSARSDEVPDITLYDHAVVTAAIACALFAHQSEATEHDRNKKKMLLVAGDVSGIQDFLLDLPNQTSPGTAKILRARSFYLTMLTRVAVVMILDRLGLPSCNCLKDAGGQFTLLVQNTPDARRKLNELRKTFEEWTLKKFHGRLALILSEPVEIDDSDFGRYNEFAEQLKIKTDLAKKRKFHTALQTESGWDVNTMVMDTVPPDEQLSKEHEQLKRLGSKLTTAKFMALAKKTNENPKHIHFFNELSLELLDDGGHLDNISDLLALYAVNPAENETKFRYAAPYSMARHVPRLTHEEAEELNKERKEDEEEWRKDQVRPFERIADAAKGVKYLAVLKADVDRLGQIFSRGLKNPSISRWAVLSRFLNEFFTGVLEQCLETKKEYENIYTEYAGGDDLLFVGPWNKIVLLASDIRTKFTDYTCRNPDITLSASVVLGHAKSPISSLVRQADVLLDQAKKEGRNRIGIFGTTISWSDFDQAIKDGDELYEAVQVGKISRGFPYRLLRYYQMYERVEKHGTIRDMLWKSQLRYDNTGCNGAFENRCNLRFVPRTGSVRSIGITV